MLKNSFVSLDCVQLWIAVDDTGDQTQVAGTIMRSFIFLILAGTMLIPACQKKDSGNAWINGEWKYNSAASLLNVHGSEIDDRNYRHMLEFDSDRENDRLILSGEQSCFAYLDVQFDLELETHDNESATFRGTGDHRHGRIIARRINNDRIAIEMITTMTWEDAVRLFPGINSGVRPANWNETDCTDLGLYDRVR